MAANSQSSTVAWCGRAMNGGHCCGKGQAAEQLKIIECKSAIRSVRWC